MNEEVKSGVRPEVQSGGNISDPLTTPEQKAKGSSRRAFLSQVGGAAAIAGGVALAGPVSKAAAATQEPNVASAPTTSTSAAATGRLRAMQSLANRVNAAQAEFARPLPNQITNGDEQRFPNHIGSFSKGLEHNNIGEVVPSSWNSFIHALSTGNPRDFEQIQMGGNVLLVDPQAGLAFDLEGSDSHSLAIGTPPSVTSAEIAAAAVENYWMALCRDVNFTDYGNEPLTQAAIAELNTLKGFKGPKPVTPQNLFRGFTAGRRGRSVRFARLAATAQLRRHRHRSTLHHLRARRGLHDRPNFLARRAKWHRAFWRESKRSQSAVHAQRPRHGRICPRRCALRGLFQRLLYCSSIAAHRSSRPILTLVRELNPDSVPGVRRI